MKQAAASPATRSAATVPLSAATGGCSSADMRARRTCSPDRAAAACGPLEHGGGVLGPRPHVQRERQALVLYAHAVGQLAAGRLDHVRDDGPPAGDVRVQLELTVHHALEPIEPDHDQIAGQVALEVADRSARDDGHDAEPDAERIERVHDARQRQRRLGVIDDGSQRAVEVEEQRRARRGFTEGVQRGGEGDVGGGGHWVGR